MQQNMSELIDYIALFANALEKQNPVEFQKCITINPPLSVANIRKEFPEPTEIDLYHIPEKFRPVLICHLKLIKAVYTEKSLDSAFDALEEMIKNLIRASSTQPNWINGPLIQCYKDLIAVYNTKEAKNPENLEDFIQDESGLPWGQAPRKSHLHRLVDICKDGFSLSFGDKNENAELSKKKDIYFFLSNLIKFSIKLGNFNFAESCLTAVKQQANTLPKLDASISNKKYGVAYLYYQGLMALDNGKFSESEKYLDEAIELMADYQDTKSKQLEQILLILIPLKLHNKGQMPSKKVWLKYPSLRVLYRDNFLKAIRQGDIAKFDESMEKFRVVLLKRHLYMLVELLREIVYVQLFRTTFKICSSLNQGDKAHIVALNAFQLALEYSTFHNSQKGDFNFSTDHLYQVTLSDVEYIFGNLVMKGKVKGYIHHQSKRIVFAKGDPFVTTKKGPPSQQQARTNSPTPVSSTAQAKAWG
ncbi:conserved hypothetical protein [Candida tropicalis MYA-3404]|uniref:Uncharacterized protein n=1 Tax=Candida tropicalis (strain ATCC MYA-3404 / T1) TaxID=294747 RepID=C5MIX8_CANTT|nr:conserved hypothetical protein [Candida tropicalis MYA-3404]EER30237.1 conserved hypothetical protein [Candida tropicalis MYA-3404]KAG4404188.1 hypothetical protein JTP64_001155 [Candida tropicalis]